MKLDLGFCSLLNSIYVLVKVKSIALEAILDYFISERNLFSFLYSVSRLCKRVHRHQHKHSIKWNSI